jgi:hypothetical protein
MNVNKSKISISLRLISLFFAVYLFNFSIDSRDPHPDTVAEDLSLNDIESFFEFVAEVVLGIENAVAEHDERDHDEGGSSEFKKFHFPVKMPFVQVSAASLIKFLYVPCDFTEHLSIQFLEIHAPPPKA